MRVYLIGSLRNPAIPTIAARLRDVGVEVFDDWFAAGPDADDIWRDYEKARGRTYTQALEDGWHASHVWEFDKGHLDSADAGVLVLPCGRSGHLELGYLIGQKKPGYILLDNPDRWDIMYLFARRVLTSLDDLEGEFVEVPF